MSEAVKRLQQQNESTLLRTVAELTQAVVSERSGLTTSMVSRMLAGKDGSGDDEGAVRRVLSILAACNLTVVPGSYKHVDPDELRAMQVLAGKRIEESQASGWGDL